MKSLFLSLGIGVLAAFASDTANRSGADGFALGGVDSPELPFVDERGAWCDVVDVDGMPWSVSVFEEADGDETARVGVSGILRAVPEFATGDVLVPSEIAGVEVVGIDDFAFQGCSNLVSVTVPDGVTHVGDFAFHGCDALVSLSLPCTATNLSPMAFFGCPVEPEFREDAQTGQDRKSAVAGSVRAVKTSRLAAVSSGGGDAMCVVSFDANGGIVEKTSETFPSGEPLGRLPIPTRDGYVFEGWYDSPIPGVGTLVTTQTVAPGIVLSLYARWVLPDTDPWQPVFRFYSKNYKGHFYTMDQAECAILMCTNPNWKYEGVAYYAAKTRLEGTVPLHRFYSKNYRGHFYTIDEAEMQTVRDTNRNWQYEGIAFYVYPDGDSAPEGVGTPIYRFWSKEYRHHFYTISESEMRLIRDTNPNWKYEMVSFWTQSAPPEILRYDVVFDGNGATSGTTAPFSAVIGRLSTLPENGFVRPGSTFAGWATNAVSAPAWQPGDTVYLNLATEAGTTVTLYAAWAGAAYFVAFNPNAEDASGDMALQSLVWGVPAALSPCAFARPGYRFAGWALSPDGLVAYTDCQEVSGLGDDDGRTVTLYAQWTAGSFTVAFDPGEGVGEMPDQGFVRDEPQALSACAFTRTGYRFAGWALSSGGQVAYADREEVSNLAPDGGTVTLHAVWKESGFTMRFIADGGTGEMPDLEFLMNVPKNLPPNAFTREGYDFDGWAVSSGGPLAYDDRQLVANLGNEGEMVELFARWNPHPYTVKFNGNGGQGSGDQSFVYGQSQALSGSATRTGYKFTGWALSSDGSAVYEGAEVVSNLVSSGSITLYATWDPFHFTIRFLPGADDVEGTMPDISASWGNRYVLPTNVFSRAHYEFAGWMSVDGRLISDADTFPDDLYPEVDGAVVELTATWSGKRTTLKIVFPGWLEVSSAGDIVVAMGYDEWWEDPATMSVGYSFKYGDDTSLPSYLYSAATENPILGFATEQYGRPAYHLGDSIKNIVDDFDEELTLYAVLGFHEENGVRVYRPSYSYGIWVVGCADDVTELTIPSKMFYDADPDDGGVGISVNRIVDGAFYGCRSLETVTVPDGVESIGENAFGGCDKLRFISLPSQFEGKTDHLGLSEDCVVEIRKFGQ